ARQRRRRALRERRRRAREALRADHRGGPLGGLRARRRGTHRHRHRGRAGQGAVRAPAADRAAVHLRADGRRRRRAGRAREGAGMSDARPLAGQVALVTGASRGIGRAIAEELARQGAHVAVNYNSNQQAADECVAAITAAGGSAAPLRFDGANPEASASANSGLVNERGRLDILVNNAGIALDGLVLRYKTEDWERILAVNLSGVFHCSKAAARSMVRARSGRIINVTSVVSAIGNAGQAPYAATKAGVEGFTRALARE